jgi:hypothetical protein
MAFLAIAKILAPSVSNKHARLLRLAEIKLGVWGRLKDVGAEPAFDY